MMSERSMILHTVQKGQHALVITHVDPDGDAIGSLTAVGIALKQMGIKVTLVCDDAVPTRFSYLNMADAVRSQPDSNIAYDLLIAVDCGDESRMGKAYARYPNPKPFIINIDHHVTNTHFGDLNLVLGTATSTTEILYGLFIEWELDISSGLASSLLTGLVTDTLGFRTDGVTAVTLHTAAALVEAGADLNKITMRALNVRAFKTIRMWQAGMTHMQMDGGLLWTSINNAERHNLDFRGNSSQGLVNMLADVEEASMGAVLMEMDDGSVKVGLRCRPPFDVSEVAVSLGGGGHKLASGCTLKGPLEDAEKLLVDSCKAAILRQGSE